MVKIAALQLGTFGMSTSRIDYYLKLAKQSGTSLVVFGEYVLNSFFTELKNMPLFSIKEQSEYKLQSLKELASKYEMTIIAPIIILKGNKIYKSIGKFTKDGLKIVNQTFLINYEHWNEDEYFDNNALSLNFITFTHERVKFGVAFGFEAHFDVVWQYFMKKKIDCLLLPTACTLNSVKRWNELLKMRAFTNNIYILRVNRLGKVKFGDVSSEFYGNSMLINPHGMIENTLDENEGLLVCDIDKKFLQKARNTWKFRSILSKNEFL